MFKVNTRLKSLTLAAALLLALSVAWAQNETRKMPPRIYALIFKADWRANCRVLAPKAMNVLPEFIPVGVSPVKVGYNR